MAGHEVIPITMITFLIDGPEHGGEHDREREERDHEEPLGDPHQDGVDLAADEPGGDPDRASRS